MTEQQKSNIIKLRNQGKSFSSISEELCLSVNTVKSFYRRKNKKENDGIRLFCKECGNPITQPFGTREKKFCSDKCRTFWWNSHREQLNSKTLDSFECFCCGRKFQAYIYTQRKFCSRECYYKLRYGGVQ